MTRAEWQVELKRLEVAPGEKKVFGDAWSQNERGTAATALHGEEGKLVGVVSVV